MNEYELFKLANSNKELKKVFVGIFASDELLKYDTTRHSPPMAFIINTEPRDKPGQHWVALYIDSDSKAQFFCSYGSRPSSVILDFCRRYTCPPATFSMWSLQSPAASSCGPWTVLFLASRARGSSLLQFVQRFDHYNWYKNEARLEKRLKSL